MSRTYRKGYIERCTDLEVRQLWRWPLNEDRFADYSIDNGFYRRHFVHHGTENYKRLIARKIKDGAAYRTHVPQDFVRLYNKTHRAQFREAANRFLSGIEDDIYFDERQRHSAAWDWL